ncbi:Uncharacterised protein [Mycobacterium tuberculosis]|nr:Uncharacterised protein [Mycobacterium tuberculosis]
MRRIGGFARRRTRRKRQHGKEGTGKQLGYPNNHPAGACQENRNPVPPFLHAVWRKETQEIDLLADLRHQRKDNRGSGAELK